MCVGGWVDGGGWYVRNKSGGGGGDGEVRSGQTGYDGGIDKKVNSCVLVVEWMDGMWIVSCA